MRKGNLLILCKKNLTKEGNATYQLLWNQRVQNVLHIARCFAKPVPWCDKDFFILLFMRSSVESCTMMTGCIRTAIIHHISMGVAISSPFIFASFTATLTASVAPTESPVNHQFPHIIYLLFWDEISISETYPWRNSMLQENESSGSTQTWSAPGEISQSFSHISPFEAAQQQPQDRFL